MGVSAVVPLYFLLRGFQKKLFCIILPKLRYRHHQIKSSFKEETFPNPQPMRLYPRMSARVQSCLTLCDPGD